MVSCANDLLIWFVSSRRRVRSSDVIAPPVFPPLEPPKPPNPPLRRPPVRERLRSGGPAKAGLHGGPVGAGARGPRAPKIALVFVAVPRAGVRCAPAHQQDQR